ncbi:MAG: hypothetical protein RSD12_02630 [Akkermansia sp.]
MSNPPPPPSLGGTPPPPPMPAAPGVPPVSNAAPSTPSVPVAPPSPIPPPPPKAPAPGIPAPPASTAPTLPLRPAGLGGGIKLGGGLKTVALNTNATTPLKAGTAPTTPLTAGRPTAQLPKATIALTPTQPISATAPATSFQSSIRTTEEEEASSSKLMLALSWVALIVGAVLVYVQVQTDMLPGRENPGMLGANEKTVAAEES